MSDIRVDTISAANGTDPVTLTKQSAAKAWLDANNDATLNDSFNISSGTDNGTGNYTHTLTNAMSGIYYSQQCTVKAAELSGTRDLAKVATAISVTVFSRADSYSAQDQVVFETVHGDLA